METQNNLLIRIDERQKDMAKDLLSIKSKLDTMVTDEKCKERQLNFNKEFSSIKEKTNTMWDERNKMIGWMLGAGIAGGGISVLFGNAVKTIFAMF